MFIYKANGADEVADGVTAFEDSVITEAAITSFLSPEDCAAVCEDTQLIRALTNDEIVTERTIVRLDKKARLSNLRRSAVFALARKKKDPKFKKLLTIWKIERGLEAYLDKKYGNQALRVAKTAMRRKQVTAPANSKHAGAVKKAISTAKQQLGAK